MNSDSIMAAINVLIQELEWVSTDDISVEIGGVAVTGTETHLDANPKWAKPKGTVTYQNDAFIVIKNKSRNPVVPPQTNLEHKQQHPYIGGN